MGLTNPHLQPFLKQYPDGGVTIDIERGTSLGVMDQLVAGKLDMAFIAHIISPFSKASNIDAYQLDHYRLYTLVVDNYHAIVSRRHRFAGLDMVTWQDLAEEKLVILDKSYGLNAIIRESFRQCGPAAQHRLRVRPGGRHPGDGGGKFRDLHPLQAHCRHPV